MKWMCWIWLALFVPASLCGCGGVSQDDMRRHALRRSGGDDEEEDDQPASAAATAARRQADAKPEPGPTPVADSDGAAQPARDSESPSGQAAADGSSGDGPSPEIPAADPQTAGEQQADTDTGQPETETERRQRSIDNLRTLAAAILRYLEDNGEFPRPAMYDVADQPLLSWRVALLPYLGYQELYDQFHREQPWDSPQNMALLSQIPDVYRSPERGDDKTNYLIPRDANSIFPGSRRLFQKHVEDGMSHTALLLEADDRMAVPWTQPEDYTVDYDAPGKGLGELRGGHFFLAWADGTVRSIPADTAAEHWKAMFTRDSGERFSASLVSSPAKAEVPEPPAESPPMASVATAREPSATVASDTGSVTVPSGSAVTAKASPATAPNSAPAAAQAVQAPRPVPASSADGRLPVPGEEERRRASQLFSSLYRSEYNEAKLDEDKQDLAAKMLGQAERLKTDPVGRFVALQVGRKIAAEAGDIRTAMDAAEDLIEEFQVDDLQVKADVLTATLRRSLSEKDNELVLEEATSTAEEALARNDLKLADRLITAALGAARRTRDPQQIADVVAVKKRVDRAQSAYTRVLDAVAQLDDAADDPAANLTAGSYFCFVVQRWDDGLPMLARGGDLQLAEVAQMELQQPATPGQQVAVADLWWELSEEPGRYSDEMQARAVHWYERALPQLDAGMQRVKAEVRIRQAGE